MTPPNFGSPGQFVMVTRQGQRRKERMHQPENIVELEDVTTSDPKSISLTQVEEELPTAQQGEIGQSSGAENGGSNPNPEMSARPDDTVGPQQSQAQDEVLVEDIIDQPESAGEEEGTEEAEADTSAVGKKRKISDSMEITLPFLPHIVPTVDDMLGKVPRLRYVDHDVHDMSKFPELAEENYLINTGEIGPLGRPVLEPVQWITGMYNSGIMNLLDIPHFGCGKNVGLCIKKLVSRVHGGILWMDKPVQIDVALISKITGFPTFGAQPKNFLENKVHEKELAEQVKAQFHTTRVNRGIIIKEINDNMTRFVSKLMACKLLRKCRREEASAGVIAVAVQCTKGMMFSWVSYLLNQFLLDYHDAQDNGTEFHYSWLIILIALARWQDPKFSAFLNRVGKFYTTRYESLWKAKYNKTYRKTTCVFHATRRNTVVHNKHMAHTYGGHARDRRDS
jgi:hypothetical protein